MANVIGNWLERVEHAVQRLVDSWLLLAGALAWLLYRFWAEQAQDFDLRTISKSGVLAWVYEQAHPEYFLNNWPDATAQYDKSLFMRIYTIADQTLGIDPERLVPYVVGLEIVLVAVALFRLSRIVFPDAPAAGHFLVALIGTASRARDINLASFAQPFTMGLWYNAADFFRFMGIAQILRGRTFSGGVLLALAFSTHPILGLMAAAFAAATLWPVRRTFSLQSLAMSTAVFLAGSFAWYTATYSGAGLSSGGIPDDVWYAMSRFGNVHWYPFEIGYFTVAGDRRFLPFVSFALLLTIYFASRRSHTSIDRQVGAGLLMAAAMTAMGLVISVYPPAPTLVKLCLHRASDLLIVFGLIYVVHGLWADVRDGRWLMPALASAILLSPFADPSFSGYPLALTIPLATAAAVREIPCAKGRLRAIAAGAVLTLLGGVLLYYYLEIPKTPWVNSTYTGAKLWDAIWGMLGYGAVVVAFFLLVPRARAVRQVVILGLVMAMSSDWSGTYAGNFSRGKAKDTILAYKEVLMWARTSTPPDALFQPDPAAALMWRDYSLRSSFGSVREWTHDSWLYNSDKATFDEGIRRLSLYGISLETYVGGDNLLRKPYFSLLKAASEKYYAITDEDRLRIGRANRIEYFVYEKRLKPAPSTLPVAYENDAFIVLAVPQESPAGADRP